MYFFYLFLKKNEELTKSREVPRLDMFSSLASHLTEGGKRR